MKSSKWSIPVFYSYQVQTNQCRNSHKNNFTISLPYEHFFNLALF